MKRLKSLMALLMALSLVLCLCACGNDEEEPPEDDPSQEQSEIQDDPTQDQQEVGTVDLAALKAQFISDYQYSDYVDVAADRLPNIYGLNADQIVDAAAFNVTLGAFPYEVVMIQASDEGAAAAIQTSLYEHLDGIAEQASSYDPESEALAKASQVVKEGCYVGMFFTENSADMAAAFQSAVA